MKTIRPLEVLAIVAILLNVTSLIAWGFVQPTGKYERRAFERLEIGKRAYQAGDHEKAFAYYNDVARNFPRSRHAGRALFLAGRTAYRALGQVDVALVCLREYAERYPKGDNVDAAKRYVGQAESLGGIDAANRDLAIWEFIQAERDYEKGRYYEALNRYQWLMTNFQNTGLQREASKMVDVITQEANRAYYATAGAVPTVEVVQ
jgi:outer membrane protein assembly factor BamD (BamD/ComL family)